MIRVWTIVFVVVVFVAGIAAGVAGERLLHAQRRGGPHGFGHGSRRPPQERLFEDLTNELSLSAEQRAQIAAVLDDAQRRARAIMEAQRPALDAARAVTRARVVAVLTPEQQARFADLEKTRGPGRGPPGMPGDMPPPPDGPGGPPPF